MVMNNGFYLLFTRQKYVFLFTLNLMSYDCTRQSLAKEYIVTIVRDNYQTKII